MELFYHEVTYPVSQGGNYKDVRKEACLVERYLGHRCLGPRGGHPMVHA